MLRISHDELQPSDDFLLLTYQGKPFTGVGFERDPNGKLSCEIEYVDGQRHGSTKDWFSSGRLKKEEQYKFGARHGVDREWYESGVLRSESEFELGVCLRRKRWDESGALVENMQLDEDSPQFATLQKLRRSTIGRLVKAS
jgi:antitoxin component YwqK of YwqJK toxin-antitoxin module